MFPLFIAILKFCTNKKLFIFLFVSVEGEYVPKEGDKVEFRTIFMPPKLVEKQAVEVKLIKMGDTKHEKWAPLN